MLTSYVVKCPHKGCSWRGSLLPRDQGQPWYASAPGARKVVFRCPACQADFEGRPRGDDVEVIQPSHKVA